MTFLERALSASKRFPKTSFHYTVQVQELPDHAEASCDTQQGERQRGDNSPRTGKFPAPHCELEQTETPPPAEEDLEQLSFVFSSQKTKSSQTVSLHGLADFDDDFSARPITAPFAATRVVLCGAARASALLCLLRVERLCVEI